MKTTTPQSQVDLASLRADYCELIVDNMRDIERYECAYQYLKDAYGSYTLDELKEEIKNDVGEDEFNDLINKNSY